MEHAEKLYLVPQNQLDSLKSYPPRENIQHVVESDLDKTISNILLRTDLDQNEKAKLYSGVLTTFLMIVKQGDHENGVLTLSLPNPEPGRVDDSKPADDGGAEDVVAEVLKNVPSRSVKNSRYILDKMSKAKGLCAWNESGEFVFKGNVVTGSHMLDLLKNVTAPHQVRDAVTVVV